MPVDNNTPAQDSQKLNLTVIEKLRLHLKTRASNAKIISILQKNPCLLRCVSDIQNTRYDRIDPLYTAKHEYARMKIIDAILSKFGSSITVKTEHDLGTGKLDIAIMNGTIVLRSNSKVICIEVKSGRSIDIFQIERYLFECDVLIVVRVPTRDVTKIDGSIIQSQLQGNMSVLSEKASRICGGDTFKVEGEWCRGCTAQCEFRKNVNSTNSHTASLKDTEDFIKSVSVVAQKVLAVLEEEITYMKHLAE